LFGYFTDFAVFVMGDYAVTTYVARVASLLVGCVIVALGAYIEVNARASMVPGDAFIHTLSKVTKIEFGKVRVVSDMSMGITAGILCLIFLGELSGVREGTVISALIVGNMVRLFSRKLKPLMDILVPLTEAEKAALVSAEKEVEISHNNKVITITREYGSCGHEIGQKLAEKLGIAFYDREIIGMAAKEGGYTESFVEEHEQKLENYLLHDFYTWYSAAATAEDMPMADQLFKIEERVIRKLVEKESCVIVGRLADYILKDYQFATKVLINADRNDRVRTVSEREKLSLAEASKKVSKIDKQRENHRHYFTHKKWNDSGEYDIVLKSNKYGVDKCVDIIASAVNN
jgi:cytidylate kinase